MKKTIKIEGMSCGHCVKHIKEALEELKGITHIEVDLASKTVICDVNADIEDKDIKLIIEDAGYDVIEIL